MRNFVQQLEVDLRAGRQNWRVFAATSLVAFAAAVLNVVAR
ncbi:MAG TPA: hypothetical protein VF698_06910 [Thermoanaerobaculia bacterium]